MFLYCLLFVVLSDWNMFYNVVCFSYYLVVVLLFEKYFFLKKDILSFEILRMNIFIIEIVLFWLRVSIKFFFVFFELLF